MTQHSICSITSLLLAVVLHAAEPTAIGWRGDGYSGVMPADCKPPGEFNGVTGQNLRWKTPLPNHGNCSPIVVAGKVFVTCDGGWPEGQDCPQLLCFDANTGKELWRQNIDHFDNLPEAEAKAARADRAEYWKQHREICTILWELRHGTPDAARQTAIVERLQQLGCEAREPALEWFQKRFNSVAGMLGQPELAKRLKKVGFESPTWGWRTMGVAMPTPASDGRAVYVATGFRTMSAFDLDGKMLWQHVITENIPTEGAFFTEQFAHSPFLVEGKLLMHWFNHLWCFEPATGRILWKTYTKPIPAHSMGQPTVLRLPRSGTASRSATGGSGSAAATETCIFTTWGQLIRLADGKLLLDKVAWFGGNAVMSGDGKDVIWGSNGAEWGKPSRRNEERLHYDEPQLKGMIGIRFRLDAAGQAATSELVDWPFSATKTSWSVYPIYQAGRIFVANGEIVAWDGKQARQVRPGGRGEGQLFNGCILADGRLYSQHDALDKERRMMKDKAINATRECFIRWIEVQDGRPLQQFDCLVEVMPAPLDMPAEQQRKVRAQLGMAQVGDHFGKYTWHNWYKTPFAAGDRLYVRTFDYLYCFGPGKP